MNITVSIDDQLAEKAREVAQRQGTSLNALIRHYLKTLVGEESGEASAEALLTLMREPGGHSGGRRPVREDAYEGRV